MALLPLPLEAAMVLLPIIGVALNGTSSVLYGSVPDLVAPERRARAFSVFYTGTIGAGAVAPAIYGVIGDALGVSTALIVVAGDRAAHAAAVARAQAGAGVAPV